MKYVITDKDEFRIGKGGFHKEMLQGLEGQVTAAGFCRIQNGMVTVYGGSAGLEIVSKPEDAALLRHLIETESEKL